MTPEDEARLAVAARMRAAADEASNALDRLAKANEEGWDNERWKFAFIELVALHVMALLAVGAGWVVFSLMTDANNGVKLVSGCMLSLAVLAGTALWRGWEAVREDRGSKPKSFDFWSRNVFLVGSLGGGVSAAAVVGAILAIGLVESAKDEPEQQRLMAGLGWQLWGSSMVLAGLAFATFYGLGALASRLLLRIPVVPMSESGPGQQAKPGA
jgi:hypothetical protein